MRVQIVSITLLSVALLSACSSATPADIRPEVARPLDEARLLANGWGDRAAVRAKLNQAASVPNLNKDEQDKIRAATIYVLARNGVGPIPAAEQRDTTVPINSLNNNNSGR